MLPTVDTQLRNAERLAVQGGDRAQTHLLLQRVRAGELSLHRVSLADVVAPDALDAWLAGVAAADDEAAVRAGLALARVLLEQRFALPDQPDVAVMRGLAQVEAWCLDPTNPKLPAWPLGEQARSAALVSSGLDETLAWITYELVSAAGAAHTIDAQAHAVEALRLACQWLDDEPVRGAVREALIGWAVGDGDPLLS
jgi:hypothetical protein